VVLSPSWIPIEMRCRVWVRDILFAVRQLNCRQSPTVFPRLCCSKEYHILCHWILSNPPRREFRKTSGNRNAIGRNSFLGDVHYTPFVHYGGRAARKVPTRPPFVPGRSESFFGHFPVLYRVPEEKSELAPSWAPAQKRNVWDTCS